MNIHPLWFLCIFVRIALVFLTIFIKRNYVIFKKYLAIPLKLDYFSTQVLQSVTSLSGHPHQIAAKQ